MKRKVAIVGGGVSGLAAAYRLTRTTFADGPVEVIVLEESSRWGGILLSERRGGFLFEGGPDSFVSQKPEAQDLCRELGLADSLIGSRADQRGAWLWWDGRLHPFPAGALMKAPVSVRRLREGSLLSDAGRRRLQAEPQVPRSSLEDESVSDFISRRLGDEVLERLVEPLMAGVYGGEARAISARFALPALFEFEKRHGAITTQAANSGGSAPASPFVTPKDGVGALSEALVKALVGSVALRPNCRVSHVRPRDGGFEVRLREGELSVDAVVLATPAPVSAGLLRQGWPDLAEVLDGISASPSIVGCFGYRRDVTAGLCGTGLLVPPAASRNLLACTWVHQKFEGRCPQGASQLRCFVGSGRTSRLFSEPDGRVVQAMEEDLSDLLGIQEPAVERRIYRWRHGLPQCGVGHFARLETLRRETKQNPGLFCVGNYLDGVGVSDCIRNADQAVADLRALWS